jgi:hypothetical protein
MVSLLTLQQEVGFFFFFPSSIFVFCSAFLAGVCVCVCVVCVFTVYTKRGPSTSRGVKDKQPNTHTHTHKQANKQTDKQTQDETAKQKNKRNHGQTGAIAREHIL